MHRTFWVFGVPLCIMLCMMDAHGQPAGWTYSVPLVIQENSGTNLTNYQVALTFDTQTPRQCRTMGLVPRARG